MQPLPDSAMMAVGVTETERVSVQLRTVHPRNFLTDPNSESIEEAMGCAIEEYTSLHKIS
jgi:hypothetical protein